MKVIHPHKNTEKSESPQNGTLPGRGLITPCPAGSWLPCLLGWWLGVSLQPWAEWGCGKSQQTQEQCSLRWRGGLEAVSCAGEVPATCPFPSVWSLPQG